MRLKISELPDKLRSQAEALMNSGQLKPSRNIQLAYHPPDPEYAHIRMREEHPAFTLPYPPTLNHLFFTVGNRRVLSKEGRAYKKNVASLALTLGLKVLTGPVAITIEVYRPRKAGDLDNTFKIILDSLKGLAWEDDKQVVSIVARRFDDKENPRVRVRVEPTPSLDPELG